MTEPSAAGGEPRLIRRSTMTKEEPLRGAQARARAVSTSILAEREAALRALSSRRTTSASVRASNSLQNVYTLEEQQRIATATTSTRILGELDRSLAHGVAAQDLELVGFLLGSFPATSLSGARRVAMALLARPDAGVLRALLAHDGGFADFSFGDGQRYLLTEACARAPGRMGPVVRVLLDHGADVNRGPGALYMAVVGGQPADLLRRIMAAGARLGPEIVLVAMQWRRRHALAVLLGAPEMAVHLDEWTDKELLYQARKRGDAEIMACVQAFVEMRREQRLRKERARGRTRMQASNAGSSTRRKAWTVTAFLPTMHMVED